MNSRIHGMMAGLQMRRDDFEGRLFEAQAETCKVFANPWRLRIVEELGDSELTVTQLTDRLGIGASSASQHLAIMRDKGVVVSRRDGSRVFYRLSSERILLACRMMRDVLLERLKRDAELMDSRS